MTATTSNPPVGGIDWAVFVAFGVGLAVGVLIGVTVWALVVERRWQRASTRLGSADWWLDREQELG